MTTYLLGVQRENSSLRIAWNKGVTTIPAASFKDWIGERIPPKASVQAVLTIPESHIILKELELPALKAAELAEAVHWELAGKSSIGAESATAWQVIEKRIDAVRVVAMSMKKLEVAAAVSFFADAGVELTAIEPASISAGRALTIPGGTSILLSLEGAEVSAVFLRNRVPVFSSSFTIPLTDAAIRAKHFSKDAAASLVGQLKRIIAYWGIKEAPVAHIIMTSEAAMYSRVKSDIARAFTIPLTIGKVNASVMGAARRTGDAVNFLPKEQLVLLEKKSFADYAKVRLFQFTKINAFVLIALAALSAYLWVSQIAYARNITQTQRFVANHPAQKYLAHISQINSLAREVSTLIGSQEDVGARLSYISAVTPPKVQFTSLKMTGGSKEEWEITGTGDRGDILSMYYKLKADKKVSTVSMPYANFDKPTGSPFTITIVW